MTFQELIIPIILCCQLIFQIFFSVHIFIGLQVIKFCFHCQTKINSLYSMPCARGSVPGQLGCYFVGLVHCRIPACTSQSKHKIYMSSCITFQLYFTSNVNEFNLHTFFKVRQQGQTVHGYTIELFHWHSVDIHTVNWDTSAGRNYTFHSI